MITKIVKDKADNKNSNDSIVARIAGASQVAGAAVAEAISMKNEAVDEIQSLKTQTHDKKGKRAISQIKEDTKNLKEVNNI